MSKFILSNNINIVQQIVADSCSAGFEVSGKFNGQICYTSFYKLSCKNFNFYAIGNDFISVVGTFIYKGKHGREALIAIYDDFSANINSIRDNVIGNCAFIIKRVACCMFLENILDFMIFFIIIKMVYSLYLMIYTIFIKVLQT